MDKEIKVLSSISNSDNSILPLVFFASLRPMSSPAKKAAVTAAAMTVKLTRPRQRRLHTLQALEGPLETRLSVSDILLDSTALT